MYTRNSSLLLQLWKKEYYDGAKATICTAVEPLIMDTLKKNL